MQKDMTPAEKALRQAVCQLAQEKSVADITVTEVCRRAEITRDSFYRFAAHPLQMLSECLYEDHDVSQVLPTPQDPNHRALGPATHLLIEHVQRNVAIYRNAMVPRMASPVREQMLNRLTAVLAAHALRYPEKLPRIQGRPPTQDAVDVLIAHAANGVIGSIEHLVTNGMITDTEYAYEVLHAATAPWWLIYDA